MARSPLPLAAALALSTAACSPSSEPVAPGPVLVVGIDGLEPSLVDRLLGEGRLPNLARFVERGTIGKLATLESTYSPVVWTTVATGQRPADHGIDFFFEANSGLPHTSETRRVPALWNLVSDAGLRVDCVGWWVTWPAERVRGRMLASYAAQAQAALIWKAAYTDELLDQTWPEGLWDDVREDVLFATDAEQVWTQTAERFPAPPELDEPADTERMTTELAWTLAADRSNTAVTAGFLGDAPGDLVMTYLALPDLAGHRFWRYHEPEVFTYPISDASLSAFRDYVALSYEDADASLGRLLEQVDESWTVIVLSDHGMHADERFLDDPRALASGHHMDAPPGVFAAMGPGVAARGNRLNADPLGSVYDVAPFVLRRLDLARPAHWPAMRTSSPLEDLLTDAWASEYPGRTMDPPDRDWIAAHPRKTTPSVPSDSSNEGFHEAFIALGYYDEDDVPTSQDD